MSRVGAAIGLGLLAVSAAAAPLLTYSLSLALFGLAHVAVELRYVEARFRTRLSGRLVLGLGLLLAGVAGLRVLKLIGLIDPITRLNLELVLVGLIAGSITWDIGLAAGLASAAAVATAVAVGLGAVLAPVATILVLAVSHNWTPVGLVAEATRGEARRRWLWWGLLCFVAMPVLLAAGPLHRITDPWGLHDASVLATGDLEAHLGAFLPADWHRSLWAPRLFSAIAFAQCMHYAVVLGVLPGLAAPHPVGPLTSIPWRTYLGLVVGLSLLLFIGYRIDFRTTRGVYAVFASVHAWVELPVLILALAPPGRRA